MPINNLIEKNPTKTLILIFGKIQLYLQKVFFTVFRLCYEKTAEANLKTL